MEGKKKKNTGGKERWMIGKGRKKIYKTNYHKQLKDKCNRCKVNEKPQKLASLMQVCEALFSSN